jgi:hypothetical protein
MGVFVPMRSALVVLAAASCSSRPTPIAPPSAPPPPLANDPWAAPLTPASPAPVEPVADVGPKSYTLTADAEVAWQPHKCHKRVTPWYSDDDTEVLPQVSPGEGGGCGEGSCGTTLDQKAAQVNKSRPDGGVCDDRHRDELEAGILAVPSPKPTAATSSWDHKSALDYRDLVTSTLALTTAESAQLDKDGFVVPERLQYPDYSTAFYDIHRGQLPLYVSADAILHAVYASNDQLVAEVERTQLVAQLDAALGAMHCGLPLAAKAYPAEIADDLDLYLTVARSLLANRVIPSELGHVDPLVKPIFDAIQQATDGLGTVEMFGRERVLDATVYEPRGHYRGDEALEKYFRAAMWLSRTEFDLSVRDSRSSIPGYTPDPRETPREAVVALALSDLANRTRATPHLASVERAWSAFAGGREDVSFRDLELLRKQARISSLTEADAAERLRAAIGDRFVRTVNVHPMPNVTHLPVIATLLGPRLTADTRALNEFVAGRGGDHHGVELGYMLGHDRALAYVDPKLKPALDKGRDALAHVPVGDDLYSHWLEAVRALAQKPAGALPAFTETPAFADKRLDSALAGYAQLRHNHVLIQARVYDVGGCEIPDGYVEPALATYQALADYARTARSTFRALDPRDTAKGIAYFTRLERLMRVLVQLSREELGNRPLSPAAKRFLSMIVERREAMAWGYEGSFPIATWDGWYFDLFPNLDVAFKSASLVIDYATFDRDGKTGVHYLGAHQAHMGVFVVDTGGKPRVMVGPVASAFEHTGALGKLYRDEDADSIGEAPWHASYTVPAVAEPILSVTLAAARPQPKEQRGPLGRRQAGGWKRRQLGQKDPLPDDTIRLVTASDLGEVTIELLDHHFVKMAEVKVKASGGRVDTKLAAQPRPVEALRVRAGGWVTRIDTDVEGYASGRFGGGKLPGNLLEP